MTIEQFRKTLTDAAPPPEADPVLQALWHDANGHWAAAHAVAQDREGTREFDRLHAYLHRKQGDTGNAAYWYHRARAEVFTGSLEDEWATLAAERLASV